MNKKERILPGKTEAFELMEKLNLPYAIKKHSIKVAEEALKIANKITKVNINKSLVKIGGLLHDIGRSKTHGFDHALQGAEIIRNEGFSEKLARICETHILGGLDEQDTQELGLPEKNYIPQSIEEKIVCLADKRILGDKKVSINMRFNRWFKRYGKTKLLIKSKERIQKFQKELNNLM
ncbi:MAG: HDIG domain-containing protein [Promethearchaeota archaeon]|nr:MAG: HDIG domain-containing protein [Candidatus Lokiarchaeota archaeon]